MNAAIVTTTAINQGLARGFQAAAWASAIVFIATQLSARPKD